MKANAYRGYGALFLAGFCLFIGAVANAAPTGKIEICHKPGERNQRILVISEEKDGPKHFGHGDYVVEPEVCDGQDSDCDKPIDPDNDVDCSDGVACTMDTCGGVPGCMNTPNDLFCDDENTNTTDRCDAASPDADPDGCVNTPNAFCGDGTVDAGEECDDGNNDDGDGCSAFCEIEAICEAGNTCDSGELGICSAGTTACPDGPNGAPVCQPNNDPVTEICDDGLDNDCDGEVDDADVCAPVCNVGDACSTGQAGICSAGTTACPDGPFSAPVCERTNDPVAEICDDSLDNDCDGEVDDADFCSTPTCVAGSSCSTGQPGVCSAGVAACPDGPFGPPSCTPVTGPSVEICDGLDNDCDGIVDQGLDVGAQCDTGSPGICAPGVLACDGSGGTQCVPDSEPQLEICDDGIDQDCDGEVDDADVCADP